MIAQWEKECLSLSVLSMVWVIIAQWVNECLSLPVLSMVWVMIAQWENKWISLSVLSVGPGSILSHGGVFQRSFTWLTTLCQPVLSQRGRKYLNLPSMAPHNLWTASRKAKIQPLTDNARTKKYI